METENKSNQKNNGQEKKPELNQEINLREAARTFLRVKKRVERSKELQREVEVRSFKVGIESYENMNNLNKSIFALSGFITSTCIKDEYWRIFGFKSRPKRGHIFNIFVNKTRLLKEEFILKELLLFSTIDVMNAIKQKNLPEKDCIIYFVGLLSRLFSYFQRYFYSERIFLDFIETGFIDYSEKKFLLLSFSSRIRNHMDWDASKSLIEGSVLLDSKIPFGINNGIFLKREVLAEYISTDIENDKFISFTEMDKLINYKICALKVYNSL